MEKKVIFSGSACALITPFSSGEIDYHTLGELIDRQIAAKTDALVIGGTTAEAAVLSDSERYRLFSYAAERVNGRCKLIFGTGTNDTRKAIIHTKYAEKTGCDGALIVTPYYNKGTEDGIEKHYLKLAESVNLPIIVYNVPSRTGVNLGFGILDRLANHTNIVGIKEASDSVDRLVGLSALGGRLWLYAGNDSQIFPTMALGGRGVISVVANLLPGEVKRMCDSCLSHRWEAARRIQTELLPLIKSLFLETNPSPVKYAMSMLGLCSEELRLPLSAPRESTRAEILSRLRELNLVK